MRKIEDKGPRLFSETQTELFEKSYEEQLASKKGQPVICLGMNFKNDDARRAHFTEELRKKLQDPEFRKIEGFPDGTDEDILALSDPPYYTCCPNPWLERFVEVYGNSTCDKEVLEPYTGDLKASERHPVYSFHPYHTKVPPEIIKELIIYYTQPNDIVLDVFCGTGMTGVAARECNRNTIVNDLSPIATFIAGVNTTSCNVARLRRELERIVAESSREWGWVYETNEKGKTATANYYVWTDVFTCPECVYEFPFFPHGVIHHGNKVETRKSFPCPSCGADLNVRKVERIITTEGKKKSIAWVNAGSGRQRISREPNEHDLKVFQKVKETLRDNPLWVPEDAIDPNGYSAKLAQLGDKAISNISRFLSERNRLVFADLWSRMNEIEDNSIRNGVRSCLTSIFTVISERQGYFGGGGGMSGNLYMPIVRMEKNVFDSLERKIKKLVDAEQAKPSNHYGHLVTTQSATNLFQIPDESIDYIYTDPPFGANIIYSEMNLILEGWLKIRTNSSPEAIIDETKSKGFEDYGTLMLASFRECYRVLKPGRWITVEFHNTQAAVWNLIQNALADAGFVVAQVCRLDKGSTTILADIRPGAVVQDLIISAYKPSSTFIESFEREATREAGVWEFVRNYLAHLPVFKPQGGKIAYLSERNPRMLFDQMIAFYVRKGYPVPLSNQEFQEGLRQRFAERDGMFFLAEQTAEYDKKRLNYDKLDQGTLFIVDEASSIEWLRQLLNEKPQTFQEIHPQFIKELGGWRKNEKSLELSLLLEQNFLRFEGKDQVPEQIHAYLSSNWKEMRNLPKDHPVLVTKARDRWYVPDPNKAGDLEKLREKALLREFDEYRQAMKNLKVFRLEAVRAGFRKAWQERDYQTIIAVAEKIPHNVLEEDAMLLMWYDQAMTRLA